MLLKDPKSILDTIEKNVARQNRFSVILNLPNIISVDQTTLNYYCKSAGIPSQTITTSDVKYLGLIIYTLTTQDIDSIMLTFYDTKEMILRSMFKSWMDEITQQNLSNVLQHYPAEYQGTAALTVENKEYKLEGIAPINLSDWILDMDNTSQLGTFTVTFKVKKIK